MKPFLEELAETIIKRYPKLEELTMVFPNRRAALFFHHYLSMHISQPAWSPRLKTIEDLFHELSVLKEADRLSLIFKLFGVYRKAINKDEGFDQFYFWGDMLLRDFDEVDKYLIPAPMLFKDLSQLRELDESFDYLTDEQKKFLKDFWLNFEDKPAGSKEEFLKVWRELPHIYREFTKGLRNEKLGYEGMIQRDVAERILTGKLSKNPGAVDEKFVFAGFNALTRSEEVLITHFVSEGAQVFWDLDEYYVNNLSQEAGEFFRQYRKHNILGSTLGTELASHFKGAGKTVDLFGVPQKVGQAKLLGQWLHNDLQPKNAAETKDSLRTVVVLPDESMLLSVMHSLPENLESVNVTMGYPLTNTPLYNLLELLMELQINKRGDSFSHRQVTAILAHAYVLSQASDASGIRLDIIQRNRVYIPADELRREKGFLEFIFEPVNADKIATYLLGIVQTLGANFSDRQSFDREYAYHFHRHLSRLHEVLNESGAPLELKGFQKLFRQVIKTQKIPFTGEPLKGLQIMGVLETRCLDFDNVYILSLNEGSLPSIPRQGSYIPHTIRKAYGLPLYDHQDAMYAYLFYRVLQRAKNIRLFYNTEPDVLGTGEMSRFIQQLIHESGWKINHHILRNPIQIADEKPINVAKTPEVVAALEKYTDPAGKGISPTALNDYIECGLRFYLKHIVRLEEAREVEEDVDARIFGNFLHNVMDWFYNELIDRKQSHAVTAVDLHPDTVGPHLDRLIDQAFRKQYDPDSTKELEYRGQRVVVRAIVKQFARRILELDRKYAPFSIELLEEKKFNATMEIQSGGNGRSVIISGRIDRVDKKDQTVRVIDYKTGKDDLSLDSIASLFAREGKRNKAAFQTILYSWLYAKNENVDGPVVPTLMNRKNLFKEDDLKPFMMARRGIHDIRPHLVEFENELKGVLEQLFDPNVLFTQTKEEKNCMYCLFKKMCRR